MALYEKSRYDGAKATEASWVQELKPEDVAGVVGTLRKSFNDERTISYEWRKEQLRAMKKMCIENEKELAKALKEDLGKSAFESWATEIGQVVTEIDDMIHNMENWLTPTKRQNSALNIPCWSTTQYEPLGIILVLGSWNYPVNLSLMPMVGAIACGNCVILKPGSYAVATSNCLARIAPKYLDQNCIRVVEGNRHVTNALLAEKFDKIFFTGSAFVGKIVAKAAAEHLTPVALELGGKSPGIVDASANIEHTANRLVWAKFLNAGQTCVSVDHLFVHSSIADKLIARIKSKIVQFYSENAQSSEWFGRLINDNAYQRLSKLVATEKDRIIHGGSVDASERYIEPTLVDFGTDFDAFTSSPLMEDELFGPILPIYRYDNLEQVIQFVKHLRTGKPLALYAFGSDSHFVEQIRTRTTSGGLIFNDAIMHLANPDVPFGGVGNSGMGSYHGIFSIKAFSHERAVLHKSQALDESILFKPLLDMRFPPYNSLKTNFVRQFGAHWISSLVNLPIPALRFAIKLLLAYFLLTKVGGYRVVKNN